MPSTSVRNTFVWQIAVFNSTSNHDFVCKPAALSVSANRDNIERGVDIETRRLSTQTSDALDRYIEHTLLVSTQSRRQKLNTRRCNLAAPQPTTTTYLSSPCFWQCATSGHLLGLTCTFRSSDTKVGPIRVDSVCRTLAWERLKTQNSHGGDWGPTLLHLHKATFVLPWLGSSLVQFSTTMMLMVLNLMMTMMMMMIDDDDFGADDVDVFICFSPLERSQAGPCWGSTRRFPKNNSHRNRKGTCTHH